MKQRFAINRKNAAGSQFITSVDNREDADELLYENSRKE